MTQVRRKILHEPVALNDVEKSLINRLQYDLPLVSNPFQIVAEELGLAENIVIETISDLLERGVITRFGPLFDITKDRGAFSLCALKVASDEFEKITELVNSYDQVAHNYQREHAWNMWFVLAAKSEKDLLDTYNEIVERSGCPGINCPKEKEFFVGLNLPV